MDDSPDHSSDDPTDLLEAGAPEATAARLAADYLDAGVDLGEVAVVSPYDDQVDRIEDELDDALGGEGAPDALEVDTVDGFQGREKEAVIVSLVRSNPDGDIGFLGDERRFNVALTRARRKAVVVGDADTVTAGDVFEAFVSYARERGTEVRSRLRGTDAGGSG